MNFLRQVSNHLNLYDFFLSINLFLNSRSLGEKLGFTPEKKETKPKKEKSAPGSATSSVKGSPTKKGGKGGKKKNPWETDSEESEDDENGFVSDSADEVILNLSLILSKLNKYTNINKQLNIKKSLGN